MMAAPRQHYFFVGIGGSGMSTLADLMRRQGHIVSGSDRSHDRGEAAEKFSLLSQSGIRLTRQEGDETDSGVQPGVDCVVVSSAIEESIIDIRNARRLNIPVLKRAELLSGLFNTARGIGISGTSGKTTTTGMTGWMLSALGLDPTIANGGIMPNFIGHAQSLMGNAVGGQSDMFVAEMDESDGTIALFDPAIAVLNNITLDHKSVDSIAPLFHDFLLRARDGAVVNLDDIEAAKMAAVHARTVTYAIDNAEASLWASDLKHLPGGISFIVHDQSGQPALPCTLTVPGKHNVSNALAALGVAVILEQPLEKAIAALEGFRGIKRRLEVLGNANGVTVIDDFAHNPDKIAATLATLTAYPGRLLVMFQPQGFGPMMLMRREIVAAFVNGLRADDILVMPEIFYGGGTVTRSISSADLISDIQAQGRNARFFDTRDQAGEHLLSQARSGDRIVVMGARDDTLTDFAVGLLTRINPESSRCA